MLDSLSSYFDLVSLMTSTFRKFFTTADYAITVPFDIKSLSYFSLLKAKTLRQTKARWCWFDKARKDDQDAGTSLGTLRFLPYEIRQQIFQILLDDYFDEFLEQRRQILSMLYRSRDRCVGQFDRSLLQIHIEGLGCSCKRDRVPNVFNLRSYHFWPVPEPLPMSLRLASQSIQREIDSVFLSRRTFQFTCPFTLHNFLDQLSPFQQRQLRCLRLSMFPYWVCDSDPLTRRDQWMAACQRLPPSLKSVEMVSPFRLKDVPGFLKNSTYFRSGQADNKVNRLATELLEVLCKKVSRASPRAVISWTGRELSKEVSAVLDAALAELEPWSEEWCTYMDGQHV